MCMTNEGWTTLVPGIRGAHRVTYRDKKSRRDKVRGGMISTVA